MFKFLVLSLIGILPMVTFVRAHPGYDLHGLGLGLQTAPLLSAPILKALPAPILDHGPIFHHEPILAHPPIIKTLAPLHLPVAPVIKTIIPATSYASITRFHIAHPAPIIKTIVAAPPPILKSYIPASIAALPLAAHGYGYH